MILYTYYNTIIWIWVGLYFAVYIPNYKICMEEEGPNIKRSLIINLILAGSAQIILPYMILGSVMNIIAFKFGFFAKYIMPIAFAWGYVACMTTSLNIIKKAEYSTTQKKKLPKLFNNKKSLLYYFIGGPIVWIFVFDILIYNFK